MKSRAEPGQGRNRGVNAFCGANAAASEGRARVCPTCLRSLEGRRRGTLFCSARCRLLAWAVREVGRALEADEANGLRPMLERLTVLRIEVIHTRRADEDRRN